MKTAEVIVLTPGSETSRLPVGQDHQSSASFEHGGGSGGGGDMNNRITRIEALLENHQQLAKDIRDDMRGIRSDVQGLERRLIDRMEENHKWVVGLIISSILIPLFIALVTK
ncbi:hypothetical protein RJE46_14215 [Cedecea neteri]|uniref:hypothetical protein n=1 Tax=Cedecea neteri TaxID=158822 RepID=UPI002892D132|nr:hypothetical protein [Cedecea neteri]WNJ77787.1 hypothetical protein RJE46_14215 [Cedecea neteri]